MTAIAAAEAAAARRRDALIDTARELQARLQPATLARGAWEQAKIKGADLAEEAVDAARARPAVTGGIAAAIALFLARGPLIELATKTRANRAKPKAKAAKIQTRVAKPVPAAPTPPKPPRRATARRTTPQARKSKTETTS